MFKPAHMEFNIVMHCNNRCVACSHGSPFSKQWYMEPEQIRRDLALLKPFIFPDYIVLIGGEPLLHPRIVEIMNIVKDAGMSNFHSVSTNGRLLPDMPDEFWKNAQDVMISAYPNLSDEIVEFAHAKGRQFGCRVRCRRYSGPHAFFLQFDNVPDGSSFHGCPWKNDCYTVHNGRFFLCPQSALFPEKFMNLPSETDGLELEGLNEQKFMNFIKRKEPLKTCSICRAYTKQTQWEQANNFEEWKQKSTL